MSSHAPSGASRRQTKRDLSPPVPNYHTIANEVLSSGELLRGIISSAMDAIISVDEDQRIIIFNAAAEKVFRCKAEGILGKPLDVLLPQRYREQHREHIRRFDETGVTGRAMGHLQPLSALRADGQEFPIEASISQVEVGGRKIFTVILRDITARRADQEQITRMNAELEQRVEERTRELEAANRELESFVYSVAHDIRAPLRHMDAFSLILLEDYATQLPEEAQQHLRRIHHSSRHLSELVSDLLDLARIGRRPLHLRETSLEALARSAIDDLKSQYPERNIQWRLLPLTAVPCDAGLIRQVFVNLLSNAVKYTRPRETAIIEIGENENEREIVVWVRDNGVGFDMKYADKLFGVFHRLHSAEEFEGTGVGLALVELIVRKHGGRVWGEGAVNRGATMYFAFPKQTAEGNAS